MPHKIFKSKGLCDFNVFIRRKNWIRVQGQIYFNQGPRLPLGMHNSYQEDLHSFLLYQYNWLHPLSNIRSIIDLLFELSGSFSYRIPTWKYPGEETSAVGHRHHTAGWLKMEEEVCALVIYHWIPVQSMGYAGQSSFTNAPSSPRPQPHTPLVITVRIKSEDTVLEVVEGKA